MKHPISRGTEILNFIASQSGIPGEPPQAWGENVVGVRMSLQRFKMKVQLLRFKNIIVIKKCHNIGGSVRNPKVPRGTHPSVLPARVAANDHFCAKLFLIPAQDVGGSIRRSIIGNDQLPVLERLIDHTVDGLGKVILAIENVEHD